MSDRPEVRTVHWCQVTDKGELRPEDPIKWRADLARMRGRRVRVTVARDTEPRSLPQNAYLWAVVYHIIAEWSGHSPEELHEAFKHMFLGESMDLPGGGSLRLAPSTRTLTVDQFGAFLDKVIRWANEQGLYIPGPHEVEVTA